MENIQLHIPTKIYFGNQIFAEALKEEFSQIKGNILLVIGSNSIKKNGYVNEVIRDIQLSQKEGTIISYDEISPNPKINQINTAIKIGLENNVVCLIGMGGGSALDAAKAIAVGVGAKTNIDEYFYGAKQPDSRTLPIYAIPTTAGTGSELSKGAIISCPKEAIKKGIRSQYIYPKTAFVNPRFTYTMPKTITKETGFDVLTHAVESYISKKANTFTEMLSIEAIKIVSDNLPKLINNIENVEARDNMSYASMIMGINLGNASTCLPHRMQYPIGALTDTSHSAGLASIYIAWIEYAYQYSEEKFHHMASLLAHKICKNKSDTIESFTTFLSRIEMNKSISELGINKNHIPSLVNNVTGSIDNDPASVEEDIIQKIYIRALD